MEIARNIQRTHKNERIKKTFRSNGKIKVRFGRKLQKSVSPDTILRIIIDVFLSVFFENYRHYDRA